MALIPRLRRHALIAGRLMMTLRGSRLVFTVADVQPMKNEDELYSDRDIDK